MKGAIPIAAVIIILLFVGIGAGLYATGNLKFIAGSLTTDSSGCDILNPVKGEYKCIETSASSMQWSIPSGGGWANCKGNLVKCTMTLALTQNEVMGGYTIEYDRVSASGASIEKGLISNTNSKSFNLINGETLWVDKYAGSWISKTNYGYTVFGTATTKMLVRSEDAAQNIPITQSEGWDVDGCHIKSIGNDQLALNAPLDLQPGGAGYTYYYKFETIPNLFNTVNYKGNDYSCQTVPASGKKALFTLVTVNTTDTVGNKRCYSVPTTFVKEVDCCSVSDHPAGYYCDMNTLTIVAEQPAVTKCTSDLQCEGVGATECKSTLSGNKLVKSGGCDLSSGTCLKNIPVKDVDCCPSPNTCGTNKYCSVSQNYICIQSLPGAEVCPNECCDAGSGYQTKSCGYGSVCCQGFCTTLAKPVCCGNGVVAESTIACGGIVSPTEYKCAVEGQEIGKMGCCVGYVMKEVDLGLLAGKKLVCTKEGGAILPEWFLYIVLAIVIVGIGLAVAYKATRRKKR